MRIGDLLAGGVLALALAACGSAPPAPSPYATAADACRAASGGGGWETVVQANQPALADRLVGTVLVMESSAADGNVGACIAHRVAGTDGFGDTTFAVGRFPPASPQPLTYVSAVESQDQSPEILLGRVPTAATAVRLVLGDGTSQAASLGGGFWVAWLMAPADPVAIEALDASGAVVGRIADSAGVQPGP